MPLSRKSLSFNAKKSKFNSENEVILKIPEARVLKAKEKFLKASENNSDKQKKYVEETSSRQREKSLSSELIRELRDSKKFREKQFGGVEKSLSQSSIYTIPITENTDVGSADSIKTTNFLRVSQIVKRFEDSVRPEILGLEARKSVSLDSLTPNARKSVEELLKSINQFPSKCEKTFQIPRFPPTFDDNVAEIRRTSASDVRGRVRSKTVDCGKPPQICDTKYFEIRGLVKFQLPGLSLPEITKLNEDYIIYENGSFYKAKTNSRSKDLLRRNVILTNVKYLSKSNKEVQLTDSFGCTYLIYFDSPKYAKQFMNNDVIQELSEEIQTTIKQKLLGFLGKRSPKDELEKGGLLKNEAIFGNYLDYTYKRGAEKFIHEIIELIERPENLKSLGLYRTSGNLSTIQKIRLNVDNKKLEILHQFARDPDVLTGSIKMFFRELREPLISMEICDQLLELAKKNLLKMTPEEISQVNTVLIKNLYDSHKEALYVLVRHMIEVVKNEAHNKMNIYNLSVCWGPSIVFQDKPSSIHAPLDYENPMKAVTQSQEAMRLVEFLISFYMAYPDELSALGPPTDIIDNGLNSTKAQSYSSKESLDSDYSHSDLSASNQSINIDELVKKLIDLIEPHLPCDNLYTKPISMDKASKVLKKLSKKKDTDTEKNKIETTEVGEALKKYLRDSQEWLVTKDVFEMVLVGSKDYHGLYLDPETKKEVTRAVDHLPKKETFLFLIKHLAKVIEDKDITLQKKAELYIAWTKVLNHNHRITNIDERFVYFLKTCIKVFDTSHSLPDVIPVNVDLIKDLKNEQARKAATLDRRRRKVSGGDRERVSESDRYSRYDNVDEFRGEAQILDDDVPDKTEDTKL